MCHLNDLATRYLFCFLVPGHCDRINPGLAHRIRPATLALRLRMRSSHSNRSCRDFLAASALAGIFRLKAVLQTMLLAFLLTSAAQAAEPTAVASRLRRPVALVLSDDESLLYVANQKSGSLSMVDAVRRELVKDLDLGKSLSDLVPVPAGNLLLATDESTHELIVLAPSGRELRVRQRLAVSPYPVSVVVSRDGRQAFVASLWSRRLSVVELPSEAASEAKVSQVIDLPFAPRRQVLVKSDRRLIVADAFGGRLAILDPAAGKVESVREVPGHNIRGLGVSSDGSMLLISHQMLNELAHSIRNDVHWGLLMSNDLRWLRLDNVLDAKADLYQGAHMHPLGGASNAAGDPAGLAVTSRGAVVVALAGVGEIAVGKESDFGFYRHKVGKRPTALTISKDGRMAYAANTFSDSVSAVDLVDRETLAEISLGTKPDLSLAERGELLFYDAALSHDSWMSCHSCHTDGHTNGLLNDNLSDDSFGAPKRVLSLLARMDTAPFAWNGSAKDASEQIKKSLEVTMQSDVSPSDKRIESLTAYLETLASPPSLDVLRGTRDSAAVARGEALFAEQRCNRCHAPPTYTTPRTYDVGLEDKQGNRKFNPPSLRGVGHREPYFHDNRAKDLDDVLRNFRHQLKRDLSDGEVGDLKAFLRSL